MSTALIEKDNGDAANGGAQLSARSGRAVVRDFRDGKLGEKTRESLQHSFERDSKRVRGHVREEIRRRARVAEEALEKEFGISDTREQVRVLTARMEVLQAEAKKLEAERDKIKATIKEFEAAPSAGVFTAHGFEPRTTFYDSRRGVSTESGGSYFGMKLETVIAVKAAAIVRDQMAVDDPLVTLYDITDSVRRALATATSIRQAEDALTAFYALPLDRFGVRIPPPIERLGDSQGYRALLRAAAEVDA